MSNTMQALPLPPGYALPSTVRADAATAVACMLSGAGRDESLADTLSAAAGDKPAALRGAVRAVARHVASAIQHGDRSALSAATARVGAMGKGGSPGVVRAAFAAALSAAIVLPDGTLQALPFVLILAERKDGASALTDRREGKDRRQSEDHARACGFAAAVAYLQAAQDHATAAAAAKAAKAAAPKASTPADTSADTPTDTTDTAATPTIKPLDAALSALSAAMVGCTVDSLVAALERHPGLSLGLLTECINRVAAARAVDAAAAALEEQQRAAAAAEAAGIIADAADVAASHVPGQARGGAPDVRFTPDGAPADALSAAAVVKTPKTPKTRKGRKATA